MPSPRFTRRSTGLLAIAGLGMTLGTVAFTPGRTLSPLRQGPPNDITCKSFLKSGIDKSKGISKTGHNVRLYRTKGYYEHISKFPKWIGAVRIRSDTSAAFPKLRERDYGCIYFQPDSVGQQAPYAQLWADTGATAIHLYDDLALCETTMPHDEDVEPDWKKEPDDCNSIQVMLNTTQGPVTHKWVVAAGRVGATMVLTELEDVLEKKGVPADEIKRLLRRTAAEGPWYPCAEFGCCRAYEEE